MEYCTMPGFTPKKLLTSITDLILPRTCAACKCPLSEWEIEICKLCLIRMPTTGFHDHPENRLAKVFWGRVHLEQVSAWFYFLSGSIYQNALHLLKYENQPRVGIALGLKYGLQLKHSDKYILPDCVVPVPLHKKKLRKRGYNQSQKIALGLSQGMGCPMVTNVLLRTSSTETQTRKSRLERVENVSGKFSLVNPDLLENKHILLVDDVITTGATIEVCAELLLTIPEVKVSVLALAFTA